ncbi:hypothetical protein [Atopobacter phocae]|uniref:hypothetical protein n=1 Tax=Atopobacter phocae TaxID=136492 RepID=UPI0004700336|nr:hypothetical protein [Atopobacter phocae]
MEYTKWKTDVAYIELVKDLLEAPSVQELEKYVQHHATTRLNHSISVSHRSYRIAKFFNWHEKEVARAGLLHDLFYHDWRETKFIEGTHAYAHPYIAYQNALKITDLNELEKDIIVKHMWLSTLSPPRFKESFLVSAVDKYCAVVEYFSGLKERWSKRLSSRSN